MNKYIRLKNTIATILLKEPSDVVDFVGDEWESELESQEVRIFGIGGQTRRIGSTNILEGLQLVAIMCKDEINNYSKIVTHNEFEETIQEIFSKIVDELESDGIIRYTPEARRRGFKIVDGNTETNNNTD